MAGAAVEFDDRELNNALRKVTNLLEDPSKMYQDFSVLLPVIGKSRIRKKEDTTLFSQCLSLKCAAQCMI